MRRGGRAKRNPPITRHVGDGFCYVLTILRNYRILHRLRRADVAVAPMQWTIQVRNWTSMPIAWLTFRFPLRRITAGAGDRSRENDSCAPALIRVGDQNQRGARGHASARHSLCSVFGWCFHARRKRGRVRPGAWKGRSARGRAAGGGTSSISTACHGTSRSAAGDGASLRSCLSSIASAAATGHGAAPATAYCRAAAAPGRATHRSATARIPSRAAAASDGSPSDAAYRRPIAA